MRKQKKKAYISDKVPTDFDWRTLVKHDQIKIAQGSGPYYIRQDDAGQEIRECMSDAGWYKVDSLDEQGIRAYNEYGFSHLYMGEETKSPTGIIKLPHKILKVRKNDSGKDI